ncbi:hypothetical protein G3N61_28030, partial [Burkholderia sp. Ac-20349]|nr:hypothetical protein [Burkholderia sp. Ac-20349]
SAASQPDARLEALTAWLHPLAERYALDLSTLAPASSDASFRRKTGRMGRRGRYNQRFSRLAGFFQVTRNFPGYPGMLRVTRKIPGNREQVRQQRTCQSAGPARLSIHIRARAVAPLKA